MSAPKYIKCPCHHCGGAIEFPAQGIGQAVDCPHCQAKTTLFAPPQTNAAESTAEVEPVSAPEYASSPEAHEPDVAIESEAESTTAGARHGHSRRTSWWLLGSLVLGGAAAAYIVFAKPFRKPLSQAPAPPVSPGTPSSQAVDTATTTNPVVPATPPALKLIEDLKVGTVTLEKAKGSSLIYAVGTLRNDSPHQRFGVKLELELSAADGRKLGVAKDYRSVLEPRQEWHFRALVLDSKAVSAKVASIREDE